MMAFIYLPCLPPLNFSSCDVIYYLLARPQSVACRLMTKQVISVSRIEAVIQPNVSTAMKYDSLV